MTDIYTKCLLKEISILKQNHTQLKNEFAKHKDIIQKKFTNQINNIMKNNQNELKKRDLQIKFLESNNILIKKQFNDNQTITQQLLNGLLNEMNALKNNNKKLNGYIDVITLKQNIDISDDICDVLYPLNLMQYYNTFIDNGFESFDELNDLTTKDLKDMGIHKIPHQKKILNKIKKINNNTTTDDIKLNDINIEGGNTNLLI